MTAGVTGMVATAPGTSLAALVIHAPDGRPVIPPALEPPRPPLLIEQQASAAGAAQLSPEDVLRYRRIFALQESGSWEAADREIAGLRDRRLMGHVLRQRYLHPDRKATWEELSSWLQRYADHAGAERIHALALRRQPAGQKAPRAPREGDARLDGSLELLAGYRPEPLATDEDTVEADGSDLTPEAGGDKVRVVPRSRSTPRPAGDREAMARLDRSLRAGNLNEAVSLLSTDEVGGRLDSIQYDSSRSRVAASLYYAGRVEEALSLASASAARSGATVTRAHWIAGLAAWRLNQKERAARHFEALAEARPTSPWRAAAAAFWAARANEARGRGEEARAYLAAAARFPHTFYGLLAERKLGQASRLRWAVPELRPEHLAALAARPDGARAIGLLQVGRLDTAERELLRINPRGNPRVEEALLALSERGGFSTLALRVGNAVLAPDGAPYDAALFPVPHWQPRDGFLVDRALIYAVMRQESRFDTRLVSSAGATGLMQIMPATARHIRERNVDIDEAASEALFDPPTNLELGQRYLAEVLGMPEVSGNLILLTAAYNAGPGTLQRWRRELSSVRDPLLFMESLPFAETRGYVQNVLANYWIYRMRLGQETASLDAIAAGGWPFYMAVDGHPAQVAQGLDE